MVVAGRGSFGLPMIGAGASAGENLAVFLAQGHPDLSGRSVVGLEIAADVRTLLLVVARGHVIIHHYFVFQKRFAGAVVALHPKCCICQRKLQTIQTRLVNAQTAANVAICIGNGQSHCNRSIFGHFKLLLLFIFKIQFKLIETICA